MLTTLSKRIRDKIHYEKGRTCRICSDSVCDVGDKWIRPCGCKGTILWVHHNCLKTWMRYSNSSKCSTCEKKYKVNQLNKNNSILSKFLYNNLLINILSTYLLGVIYLVIFEFSKILHLKYKGLFFHWLYVMRGIAVTSILFYIALYFLSKKINQKLVEDVKTPNILLENDNIFISSLIYIPLNVLKIFKKIFQKHHNLSTIEILDFN